MASLAAVAALVGAGPAEPAQQTVTISGRAYAFNHMDTFLAGATIRVRELPSLSATADANGDYALDVPDETTVTPYIDPPPGYHQIDLQTFHTRGKPIRNANFQVPGDAEYNGLAALLSVPFGPDGRPEQCVIVTTASARDVRGVDYDTFHARTPHGVAGATARTEPPLAGPIYFNEDVIPDRSRTATSGDGGIIWTGVPAGTYRVITESPRARRLNSGAGRLRLPCVRELPRHLRAGPGRERKSALGRVRARARRAAARRRGRGRRGRAASAGGPRPATGS